MLWHPLCIYISISQLSPKCLFSSSFRKVCWVIEMVTFLVCCVMLHAVVWLLCCIAVCCVWVLCFPLHSIPLQREVGVKPVGCLGGLDSGWQSLELNSTTLFLNSSGFSSLCTAYERAVALKNSSWLCLPPECVTPRTPAVRKSQVAIESLNIGCLEKWAAMSRSLALFPGLVLTGKEWESNLPILFFG